MESLLSAGANPGLRDHEGFTALAFARDKGHLKIVQVLEAHGASS